MPALAPLTSPTRQSRLPRRPGSSVSVKGSFLSPDSPSTPAGKPPLTPRDTAPSTEQLSSKFSSVQSANKLARLRVSLSRSLQSPGIRSPQRGLGLRASDDGSDDSGGGSGGGGGGGGGASVAATYGATVPNYTPLRGVPGQAPLSQPGHVSPSTRPSRNPQVSPGASASGSSWDTRGSVHEYDATDDSVGNVSAPSDEEDSTADGDAQAHAGHSLQATRGSGTMQDGGEEDNHDQTFAGAHASSVTDAGHDDGSGTTGTEEYASQPYSRFHDDVSTQVTPTHGGVPRDLSAPLTRRSSSGNDGTSPASRDTSMRHMTYGSQATGALCGDCPRHHGC